MRLQLLGLAILLSFSTSALAEPVAVKYSEGSVHGFLLLRDAADGKILASGDLTQVVHGWRVVSHLVFRFKDGSSDDETTVFTEHGTFHLISDRHVQKGPSFPKPMDVLIEAERGRVTVRYDDKGTEKTESATLKIPADVANGVIFDILKNISRVGETKLSWIAATPKPRLVKLSITVPDKQTFSIGGSRREASRFQVNVELGGIAGAIAPLIGKEPEDTFVWISGGEAPAFLKSDGPQYVGGPRWQIQITGPEWPGESR